jgi:hypothetical protein
MASKTTKIDVTVRGGELYLLARYGSGGDDVREASMYEICHVKSGPGYTVKYSIVPQHVLQSGDVALIMVGISWGGSYELTVTLSRDQVSDPPYTALSTKVKNAGVKLLEGGPAGYVPGERVPISV